MSKILIKLSEKYIIELKKENDFLKKNKEKIDIESKIFYYRK
jgi:hypothetical protein